MLLIMDEKQLNLLIESMNGRGPNWDIIVAIATFLFGFVINGVINRISNSKAKKADIANSFWMLFVVLQNIFLKVSYYRFAVADQRNNKSAEEILLSYSSQPISELSQDLWNKFHSFDSQIDKRNRKKGTFVDFNLSVIELFELMEKVNLLIVTKRSDTEILSAIVKLEDKLKDLIERYNEKAIQMKLKTN